MARAEGITPIIVNDSLESKFNQFLLIQSQNRIADSINSIERDKDNMLLWVVSIALGAVAGFSLSEKAWWLFTLILDSIFALLIYYIYKRSSQEQTLINHSKIVQLSAKKYGLDLDLSKTWL